MNTSLFSIFGHLLACLLLRANHDEIGTLCSCLHAVVAGTIQVRGGLNKVEDVSTSVVSIEILQHLGIPLAGLVTILDTCFHQFWQSHHPSSILRHFPIAQCQLLEFGWLKVLADVEDIVPVMSHVVRHFSLLSARVSQWNRIYEVLGRKLHLDTPVQLLTYNLLHEIQVLVLVLHPTLEAILPNVPGFLSLDHRLHALGCGLCPARWLSDLHDDTRGGALCSTSASNQRSS
mmetsp:Transcript_25089/g.29610  ORF Transcript_25089/g.29610 Transcript_25089/m.29610 type:complete len:232 (+) Transcript_25089:415-1110(+)